MFLEAVAWLSSNWERIESGELDWVVELDELLPAATGKELKASPVAVLTKK